ncbi:MAG: hypothetical protein ACI9JN_000329 [Bacteroidia bacterium]|jgi:hypothetical protein
MKLTVVLITCLLFVSLLSHAQQFTDTTQAISKDTILEPIISFEMASFDLGSVPEDTIITRVFTFSNTGNDSLTILGVTADCSCTVPEFELKKYGEGASGQIKVRFNGKDNAGRFIQYITVLHDAEVGYTFLTLKGFVERSF